MADAADMAEPELGIFFQFIHDLSQAIGFSDQTTIFFLTVLLGYPLALIPRSVLYHAPAKVQHIYYIILGLCLAYINFGTDTIHYLITILFNYVLMAVNGGTLTSVVISFVYNMTYFLIGTYSVSDGTHDVRWDTPHCVMVLKVVGVAYDLYDGRKKKEEMSQEQQMHYLTRAPSLLEMAGYCLFFGGFLAGPQFSMRRYLNYTSQGLLPEWEQRNPSNVKPAISRFFLGVIYVTIGLWLNVLLPDSHFSSDAFKEKNLFHKLFTVFLWGTSYRTRYGGMWLLTEGVCILSGISYSGLDDHGQAEWKASAGMNPYELETAVTFRDLVANYNISTNKWAGRCIYKRCKFLGNRQLSQFLTLMFLAAWHGAYIGYYHCFLCEMFCLNFEEQWKKVWHKFGLGRLWDNPFLAAAMSVFCNFFIMTSFAYSLVSFQLAKFHLFNEVYASMYYVGHAWYISWTLLFPLVIRPLLGKQKPVARDGAEIKSK